MIKAEFFEKDGEITGFRVNDHADYAESGEDIVCAAVSSAVQLTANLLDALDLQPDINLGENVVECMLPSTGNLQAKILGQFRLHLESVQEEFPENIKITISEV
ncbi:MAG: ribosomal-processing cysteine protease Prp [Ruminococcus sp.]|nr:ribosomal-processing cysteine protease Prp [Ruminococcus sp.]